MQTLLYYKSVIKKTGTENLINNKYFINGLKQGESIIYITKNTTTQQIHK